VSKDSTGRLLIVAALISSAAVIAAALLVSTALDRTTEQVALAVTALAEQPAPSGARPTDRPSRPRRPDPGQEYEVSVGESPVRGGKNAPITIVEWSDFQCPFCKRASPTLAQIEEEYGDKVRIVFKHLPLSMHAQAPGAHAAAEAAHRQGKFWEMHDKIFEQQRDLAPATFERYAAELGLDVDRFKRDVASAEVKKRIDEDTAQAQELGVTGTPAFFINGRFLSGAQPFVNFKRVIDGALEKES
jgi:protein-disulfide isomerase